MSDGNDMNKKERVAWIDILKGLACIGVFLHHYLLCFYPATFVGEEGARHLSGRMELWLSESAAGVFVCGDFWVTVFCLLSGFVAAKKIFEGVSEDKLSDMLIARYLRLVLPIFVVSAVSFAFLHLNLYKHFAAGAFTGSPWLMEQFLDKTEIEGLFYTALAETLLKGHATQYSHAFWMLHELFFGYFVAVIAALASKGKNKRIFVVYGVAALLLICLNSHYAAFLSGVVLAKIDGDEEMKAKFYKVKAVSVIAIILGLFFGGYPTQVVPTNYYRFLSHLYFRLTVSRFWHMIGAFIFIYGVMALAGGIRENKVSRFMGRTSFAVYLWHIPIIYSAGCALFAHNMNQSADYAGASLETLSVSFVITVVVAWAFAWFIEPLFGKLIAKVLGWLK